METIDFDLFGATGVLGTDTFETWRLKTNGIIGKVSTINSSYASRNGVLLLDNSAQTVLGNKIFSNGITVGGSGGNVPLTVNSSSELLLTNNLVILGDKTLSANTLISGSGKLTLGGRTYQWPTLKEDQIEGYVYHNPAGNIAFESLNTVVDKVKLGIAKSALVSAQEITPVGTVIGVRLNSAPSTGLIENTWLLCDGETTYNSETYPELAAKLEAPNPGTFTTPDLRTKVLMGSSGATGFIGSTGATGAPSYYDVHYYIKAKKDATVTFTLNSGNGVTLLGKDANSSIDIYGGTVSLNVGSEFTFDINKRLLLSNGEISYTKLANASTTAATGSIGIPLRDTNGYVRGNTPGIVGPTAEGSILVNKAYVDNLAESKDHKIRSLNGKGYNSYGVQPYLGAVFVNYENHVKAYGASDGSRALRYGDVYSNALGYTLPIYSKNATNVYSDTYNTYIKYADDTVYSYGWNSVRKTGVALPLASATYLTSPNLAFDGEPIDEVILSYSTAETVYAITKDGRLWVAGSNAYGQLGLGPTAPASGTSTTYLPRATNPGGKTVRKAWLIGDGNAQTGYVLATDDTLWACGYGGWGQMGRINFSNSNPTWVPVLNPVTSSYTGGTTAYDSGTYTSTSPHGLQDYDIAKSGTLNYVVKVLSANTFQLCSNDLLVPITSSTAPLTFSGSTQIHKRMTGIANAAFGGTGGLTFGYIQTTDGTLYAWGYGGYGQLGNGSTAYKSLPTAVEKTIGSTVKSQALYTGLDHTVHFVSTAATGNHLYACGRNNYGQLGIGQNVGYQSQFQKVSVANLSDSGLQITGNDYSVHQFFSPGTNCRFCVFQSGTNKKLTAWGENPYNKLGTHNNAASHNAPQNVYVENDSNVTDVQTTIIRESSGHLTTLMTADDSQEYGDLHTCGYHYYNVGAFPNDAAVPYLTKSKNI
jgi:alpha-tubulin suppressor-like RCC1 family protein